MYVFMYKYMGCGGCMYGYLSNDFCLSVVCGWDTCVYVCMHVWVYVYVRVRGLFAAALSTILSLGLRAFDAPTIRAFAACKITILL
jgi:hypothetical protein